jgi:hypothetical protein
MQYKKMAGTAAVFIVADKHANSPVERDGMVWSADELKIQSLPEQLTTKDAMASTLALEGLEDYDPPSDGDVRKVGALAVNFVYIGAIKGWVETEMAN